MRIFDKISYGVTKFIMNKRGGMESKVISMLISVVILAALAPTIILQLINANTTGWGATEIAIWAVFPVIIIVAMLYMIVGYIRGRGRGD